MAPKKASKFSLTGVYQKSTWDCGVAAFATVAQVSYDVALNFLGRDPSTIYYVSDFKEDEHYDQIYRETELALGEPLRFGVNEIEMQWAFFKFGKQFLGLLNPNAEMVKRMWLGLAWHLLSVPQEDDVIAILKEGAGLVSIPTDHIGESVYNHWLCFNAGDVWDCRPGHGLSTSSVDFLIDAWKTGYCQMLLVTEKKAEELFYYTSGAPYGKE